MTSETGTCFVMFILTVVSNDDHRLLTVLRYRPGYWLYTPTSYALA